VAPCPYCYNDIDLRAVDFRCLGRPAPGRPVCPKQVDPIRRRKSGDLNAYYPAFTPPGLTVVSGRGLFEHRRAKCPRCFGETGIRLCPQCHSRIPEGFAGDSPLFGLVGPRSAGKTVMLAVLLRELATNGPVARRFGHVITLCDGGPSDGQGVDLRAVLTNMEDHRLLPDQTLAANEHSNKPVVFEWKIQREGLGKVIGDYKSTVFSFYDAAGEGLASDERALSRTYLLATDGAILLLDPFSFPNNSGAPAVANQQVETAPEVVLQAVTQVLRQGEGTKANRRIKQPVAVVISKIDAFFGNVGQASPIRRPSSKLSFFDEAESASVHDHIGSMVRSWGGEGLLGSLDMNYANYRLFGLSALGHEPDYAARRIDPRGLAPHRVAEPLLWLMAERGFIQRQG
jgi:hypothetical protein